MDSLTQIVLGASVGEAVLGKKVGNKAMLYGAIAGTIPDLDTFTSYFVDTVTAIELHRGLTHSIFFAIVFAPIFGKLISLIERKSKASWKDWTRLMFWGFFTHPLLDSFTTWGTQLFWPFDIRLAFKSIFVIDPLYTIPFLIFVILAMRKPKNSLKRRRYNKLGLFISTGYLLLSLVLKGIAYQQFIDHLEQENITYKRIETRPSPLNTILWSANIELKNAYLVGHYSFFDEKYGNFKRYPKQYNKLGKLKNRDKIQRLIDISNGWYTITEENGHLFFNDLRFGKLNPYAPNSKFVFSYKLLEKNGKLKVKAREKDPSAAKALLKDLWERLTGN